MTLQIHEIYRSIQGETSRAGLPATLIRLAGCNLDCRWCDTRKARGGAGQPLPLDEVLRRALALAQDAQGRILSSEHFLVTGGEPLLQAETPELLRRLADTGAEVLLETNGSLDLGGLDPRVRRIVDLKAPGSGMDGAVRWENLALLGERDELKVVLASRDDYEWALHQIRARGIEGRCGLLLSPAWGLLPPRQLVEWMLADRVAARLQLQLHKFIWGPDVEGV